ncbi:hypothetical protein D3C72_1783010 [compost metagenome]
MRLPSRSNSAHEKSRRSLIFTEWAVCCRRSPICSAMDMKRLLKTSSITGSASVPKGALRTRSVTRVITIWFSAVTSACQPCSTTVVELASAMMAGPSTMSPACIASRTYSRAFRHSPLLNILTTSAASSSPGRGALPAFVSSTDWDWLVASTVTVPTTMRRAFIRKENRCR